MAEQGIIGAVLTAARNAFTAKPSRVAAVQLGPSARQDMTQTSAYDLNVARASRQRAAVASLGPLPFDQSRAERVVDYREIAEEVPELAKAVEVFVDFVFGNPDEAYSLKFSENARPEVVRTIEAAEQELNTHKLIRDVVHEGVWLDNSFTELVFADAPTRLVGERALPQATSVMVDEWGNVDHFRYVFDGASKPRQLAPFQVIHYAPGAVRGSSYGRGLLYSARGIRRRHEGVDDVTTMLALRKAAGDVLMLWPFPSGLSNVEVENWIRQARQSVEHESFFDSAGALRRRVATLLDTVPRVLPFRTMKDVNMTPTVVETEPADLKQLVDVLRHMQDRFFVATGVPKALVGIERDVNSRATLEQQALHFSKSISNKQRDASKILNDVFIRACLVQGIVPEPDEYSITMSQVSVFDEALRAEILERKSRVVKTLTEANVPLRFALATGFPDLEEATITDIVAAVDAGQSNIDLAVSAAERLSALATRIVAKPRDRVRARENQPPKTEE